MNIDDTDTDTGPGRGWAAGLERPHRWACRHCGMVADYRLQRDAEIRQAEGIYRQDEDYRPVVFKDWLRHYQWETENAHTHDGVDGIVGIDGAAPPEVWAAAWATHAPTDDAVIPRPRTAGPDPVAIARLAVDAIPDLGADLGADLDAEADTAERLDGWRAPLTADYPLHYEDEVDEELTVGIAS